MGTVCFHPQNWRIQYIGKRHFWKFIKKKKKVISYILQDWLKISTLGVHTNYIVYLINNVYFNYPKYNLDKFIIQSFSREFGTLPINSS